MKNDQNTSRQGLDQMATILTIDDEEHIRQSITAYLEDYNFHVIEAANGHMGLELFRRENPDLILVDLRMPDMDGLEVLATVKHEAPQTPLIVLSGKGTLADAVEALHLGAWDYIVKPIQNMSILLNAIQKALERAHLLQENHRYREHLEEEIARRTKEFELANKALTLEIRERKRAEKIIRQQNEFLENILESLLHPFYVVDSRDYTIKLANSAAQFGSLSGKSTCYALTHHRDAPCEGIEHPCPLQVVKSTKKPFMVHHIHYDKDNNSEYFEIHAYPIFDQQGNVKQIIEYSLDITDRKRVEAEMSRLRNFMKNIIDSMPSVLVGVDLEGRVTHWNLQAERTTRVSSEEARGRMLADVFPQLMNHIGKVHRAIQQRTPQRDEKVISRIDGENRYLDVIVYPLVSEGAVILVDDVTSRVRVEEIMIQSEKILSVGGLAAGIAHELNNPLAGMLQNTQVVLNRLTKALPANSRAAEECGITIEAIKRFVEKREIAKMLEMVRISGERATQIVQDMLSFSHKSEHHIFPFHDIRKLLEKSVDLAFHIYDLKGKYTFQQIEILQEYDPNLPEVPCEPTEIQQVLLNLLMNAAQAMTEQEERSKMPGIILRTVQDGNMVRIEVEDNGPGMPEYIRKRVFEPFFTTKEVGVGTGLGLSVSYFIITKNHGGTMSVESHPGQGTKFIICLPLAREPMTTPPPGRGNSQSHDQGGS